uniref:adhesion G protein-coupled receptor E2 isoform X1 n=3 Tax=Epinephelus lanceolatus TaxID=310571 RepID=UPI00144608D4|nr:adhesion G protein-coupled receptor E2 isoform X1 [Epinephelus lanceolatus]
MLICWYQHILLLLFPHPLIAWWLLFFPWATWATLEKDKKRREEESTTPSKCRELPGLCIGCFNFPHTDLDSVSLFTMAGRWNLLILALYLSDLVALTESECAQGWISTEQGCIDNDECAIDEDYPDEPGACVENASCVNTIGSYYCQCLDGFVSSTGAVNFTAVTPATCEDINECLQNEDMCGPNAECHNTVPHYSCICDDGFISTTGLETFRHGDNVICIDIDECGEKDVCGPNSACVNAPGKYHCICQAGFELKSGEFTGNQKQCEDINECEKENICGQNAACVNTPGKYHCICHAGFELRSGRSNFSGNQEQCEDKCMIDKTICGNGICHRGASGHYCVCHPGSTNYGNNESRCTELRCDVFEDMSNPKEGFHISQDLVMHLKKSCLNIMKNATKLDGEDILKRLLSAIDELLSSEAFKDKKKVSTFLDMVENVLRLIGPLIKPPGIKISSTHTELELLVHKGANLPQGPHNLTSKHAQMNIQLETAAGDPSYYPGFTTASLLTYANLEHSADSFFSGMEPQVNHSYKINSKVVTASVSNRNTSHLKEPVTLTFYHLKSNESQHTCVFWDSSVDGGSWSTRGCKMVESNSEYTVCSCNHLSSFAVLMALYDVENKFELQLITWVGLSLSLICLFICILTFSLIHSIKSPRTSIHLHLCISLFIAYVIFLAGISRTESRVGCAVVAGLLHFFFLAAFCWMCLEGIQLFRMVVIVFNTNFKTLYMMAGGYGVPAVIVAISAMVNAEGYGTKRYCWLKLDFIWSFFGPACIIIIINIFFFLITVWKLAQKFSSLNPDLDKLQKIKAFTITAVAQLCLLGNMWIFGCFQFNKGTIVMSYLFTIFGSIQGIMLFVMHCLFSKQVREEYGSILSRYCAPGKKSYSDFSYSHTSKAQGSRSTQDTGESHI